MLLKIKVDNFSVWWMLHPHVKRFTLPGLHAWFDFNHFIRDVDHSDGDLSRLQVVLPFEVVVHSSL